MSENHYRNSGKRLQKKTHLPFWADDRNAWSVVSVVCSKNIELSLGCSVVLQEII